MDEAHPPISITEPKKILLRQPSCKVAVSYKIAFPRGWRSQRVFDVRLCRRRGISENEQRRQAKKNKEARAVGNGRQEDAGSLGRITAHARKISGMEPPATAPESCRRAARRP